MNQYTSHRKSWLARRWWLVALILLIVVMAATNPSNPFDHNQAVLKSSEQKIYPALLQAMRVNKLNGSNAFFDDDDDDDDDLSNLEWSIANTVASSKLGGTMIVDEIANSLRVENVVNMLVLSIGYHNDDEVTVGLFGHVWTIYDFMSNKRIAHEINDNLFDD